MTNEPEIITVVILTSHQGEQGYSVTSEDLEHGWKMVWYRYKRKIEKLYYNSIINVK